MGSLEIPEEIAGFGIEREQTIGVQVRSGTVGAVETARWVADRQEYDAALFIQANQANAPPLKDPTNGLVFPDLNSPPFGGETFRTNLIMPEPCPFLSRGLPVCSIIRPTETKGVAMGVVKFLTAMGLFMGSRPRSLKC